MRKTLTFTFTIFMVLMLFGCSLGNKTAINMEKIDSEAIENTITRIEANELDSAIKIIQNMDEKTLDKGRKDILNSIISEISIYLNYNSWVATDYYFVDEIAIKDIEKYKIIVNALSFEDDETNVDDFIDKALNLKRYIKWNTYQKEDCAEDFTNIKNTMDRGAVYKSSPSIASKYYKQAYDMCMDAYYKYNDSNDYGVKEASDFYYNFAVQINGIITRSGTTSSQDNDYNNAHSEFVRIQDEHIDALDEIIDICGSFPKKLY